MARARYPKAKRQYIDNLERVAADLLDYTRDLDNVQTVVSCVEHVSHKYKYPLESWVWSWIYQFTRQRGDHIDKLASTISSHASTSESVLIGLKTFFAEGAWESTSANTTLMYDLLSQLQQYTEQAPQDALTPHNLQRLSQLFSTKVDLFIEASRRNAEIQKAMGKEDTIYSRKQAELAKELRKLRKKGKAHSKHAHTLEELFDINRFQEQVNEKNNSRADRTHKLKLNASFKNRLESIVDKQSFKVKEAKNDERDVATVVERELDKFKSKDVLQKPQKINSDLIKLLDNKLGGMFGAKAAQKDAVEKSGGELCRAAFEAPDKVTYSAEKEKPQVQSLRLSGDRLSAMSSLFGASAVAKLVDRSDTSLSAVKRFKP